MNNLSSPNILVRLLRHLSLIFCLTALGLALVIVILIPATFFGYRTQGTVVSSVALNSLEQICVVQFTTSTGATRQGNIIYTHALPDPKTACTPGTVLNLIVKNSRTEPESMAYLDGFDYYVPFLAVVSGFILTTLITFILFKVILPPNS